ncbi:hypothetical protein CVT26_008649 [Gymnopilus dilepis]|uniref:F-box domain-containing protein n=1 Tax=Gymnopilus dilepis TaxID=231916 RepID=A0A409XXX6_9AGAR|nr:hypothetical protein CVT26_008649 [Gymnopilus dilepis]
MRSFIMLFVGYTSRSRSLGITAFQVLILAILHMQVVPEMDPPDRAHAHHKRNEPQFSLSDGLLGLFDSFPVEIISTIFLLYVCDDCWKNEELRPGLTLGKICKGWRQVAWSTPNLWTSLIIRPQNSTSMTHVDLAREWLARSGSLPISIEFTSRFNEGVRADKELGQVYEEMTKLFNSCSGRWYSLSLSLPSSSLEAFPTLECSPSMLQNLSLSATCNGQFRIPNYQRTRSFANWSPAVVEISCLNVILDWKSVLDLSLDFVDIAEVLYIFKRAPNLKKCSLKEVRDSGTDVSTIIERRPIICPVLESLIITFIDKEAATSFCNAVSLPALKHLEFCGYDIDVLELSMDELIFFLTKSSCALQSLFIFESDFELGSLIRLAPFLSSIKELYIHYAHSFSDMDIEERGSFYHLLADQTQSISPPAFPTDVPLLPFLEKFQWFGPAPFAWEILPGLLEPTSHDGLRHCRPLKSVEINCDDTEELEDAYIPKDIVLQLSVFNEVKFDFTLDFYWFGQHRIDLWKASMEEFEAQKGEEYTSI